MIWFFERGEQRLQCEINAAADGNGFELAWETPDGQRRLERSQDPWVLMTRRRELEEILKRDGWKRLGSGTPPQRFL